MNIEQKKCGICGKMKSTTDFCKEISKKDGLSYCCKECKKNYRLKSKNKINNSIKAKECVKCGKLKNIGEFYRKTYDSKDGYLNICKECHKLTVSLYRKSEEGIKHIKQYHQTEGYKERHKIKERNKRKDSKIKEYHKIYNQSKKVKEYNNIWHINKYRKDTTYKINNLMSKHINRTLQGNKNRKHWETLVGYTIDDLKKHLESKFRNNMSWNNMGKWHIDHIIPVSLWKFSSFNDREFKQCWALCNLQPLWGEENIKKGNRI